MENEKCNLCEGQVSFPLYDARDYITETVHRVVRCQGCGLVRVSPMPLPAQMSRFYPKFYYGDKPFLYEKLDALGRFRQIRPHVGVGSRVLDVGCGRGLVLAKLKAIGCEVVGTELSAESSRYAREGLGIEIHLKNLVDCKFQSGSFDFIAMFHSLEHLHNPTSELREAHRLLKPDGHLLVEVPSFNSFFAKVFKKNWFHLDVPRHLYHFEEETLIALLKKSELDVVSLKKFAIMYDSFGGLQSLLNTFCSQYNLLNDINTKRKSGRKLWQQGNFRRRLDLIFSIAAQLILYVPFVLLAYLQSLFNAGGTLRVLAVRATTIDP